MTDKMGKIIRYIKHGVDDRIILLEMIRATKDVEFIRQCEHLIGLQIPNELQDLQNKFERVANKINAIDEHLKLGGDQDELLDLAIKHYATLKKIETEISKNGGK